MVAVASDMKSIVLLSVFFAGVLSQDVGGFVGDGGASSVGADVGSYERPISSGGARAIAHGDAGGFVNLNEDDPRFSSGRAHPANDVGGFVNLNEDDPRFTPGSYLWNNNRPFLRPHNIIHGGSYLAWVPQHRYNRYRLRFRPRYGYSSWRVFTPGVWPRSNYHCSGSYHGITNRHTCFDLRSTGLLRGQEYVVEISYWLGGSGYGYGQHWSPWIYLTTVNFHSSPMHYDYGTCGSNDICWSNSISTPCSCGPGTHCGFRGTNRSVKYCLPDY